MLNRKPFFLLIIVNILFMMAAKDITAIEKCTICHGKTDLYRTEASGKRVSLHVTDSLINQSIHNGRACTDCHVDIVAIPHEKPKKVNCRRCHYTGNPVGAPEGDLYDQYEHSVHGVELLKGNPKAPVCADCHGTHLILAPNQVNSTVYKKNRPKTCGKCHIDIYATYKESIHGQALEIGNLDSPDCSSCHGEHNITRHADVQSKVAGTGLVQTCSECHGTKGVASKYGIKTDRVATFEHSFHGVATEIGNTTVANCASCHGYHDIRPEDDPKSMINPANIMNTCGKQDCHPEATPQFASGQIHIDPTSEESGLLYYITKFFLILTVSTLAGLFILILLDLYRRAKNARESRRHS